MKTQKCQAFFKKKFNFFIGGSPAPHPIMVTRKIKNVKEKLKKI